MLNVLLFILKIIGIIIAAILGILVLLLCIVLFVPIRYDVQARSEGTSDTLKAKLKVTWFLHLFRADVYYKDQKLMWRIRFALFKRTAGRKGGVQHEDEKKEIISESVDEKQEEVKDHENTPQEPETTAEDMEKIDQEISGGEEKHEETVETISQDFEGSEKKRKQILQKIQRLYQKIKCTFQQLYAKMKLLTEKREKLTAFVQEEVHVRAFKRLKKVLFWYLKKIRPKKVEAACRYGFEDPYYTGKLLAGLAILYPFMGEDTEIIPDFEHRIFKGRIRLRGKLKVDHLAWAAWQLYWNKDIRYSYRDIKNFEL